MYYPIVFSEYDPEFSRQISTTETYDHKTVSFPYSTLQLILVIYIYMLQIRGHVSIVLYIDYLFLSALWRYALTLFVVNDIFCTRI